jgi:hypothetical protein
LTRPGHILRNDAALASSVVVEGLKFTAVLLVSGSSRAALQSELTAVRTSPSPMLVADHTSPLLVASCSTTGTVLASETSAAPIAQSRGEPAPSAKTATPSPVPAAATLRDGSRVRIEGLQAKPQMNGRTGVVYSAFDEKTGRWTVDVTADSARPACRCSFRAANLRLIPSHNFGTEWVDEGGRLWPKDVDFSRQCAKGHALAPLGERGGLAGVKLLCRLCHCFCERDCDDAASWLMCSEDASCCGEYAVCCCCARSPSAAATACSDSDDFRTLVRRDGALLRFVTAKAT